jgi:hypothetical protein
MLYPLDADARGALARHRAKRPGPSSRNRRRQPAALAFSPQPGPLRRLENKLSPRIGTFSQTGTLADLIDRLLPARLSLFHGLQRGGSSFEYARRGSLGVGGQWYRQI